MSVALKPIAELASSYAPRASLYAAPHDNVSDDSLSESDQSVGFHDDIIATSLVKKPAAVAAAAPTPEVSEAEAEVASEAPELTEEEQIERLSESMLSMPLAEIDAMRHTSAVAEAAANRVAPTPLGTPDVAFVRWVPEELHTAVPSHATTKRGNILPPTFSWRCLSCGEVATGPRECQHCRTPIAVGACRVFLGQVRKDLTAEMVTAMLRSLAPDVTILHIESHTNGTDGRGKGCAWAYVNSVEDAVRVTALHKRVFVDLDADKKEGFWFAKDPALRERLIAFADVIGAAGHRPAVFPRQPLVAELPAKSMLARYVQSAYPRAGQQ